MSGFVPIIRADVLAPALRWMISHGRDVDSALRAVDLDWYPWDDPHAIIPVKNGAHFFFNLAQDEGPDIAFRVVAETGVLDIGLLGNAIAHCPTPRSVLTFSASMMPYQCTHEVLLLSRNGDSCVIADNWTFPFKDQKTRHIVAQYVLALIHKICRSTGKSSPPLRAVRMVPHPEFGLSHLRPWLDCDVQADVNTPLEVEIPASIADHPFPKHLVDAGQNLPIPRLRPLRGDGGMAGCLALLAKSMMKDGAPSLDRMATIAGVSRRTLQRRLAQEGISFSDVIDMVRQDIAAEWLQDPRPRLRDLSAHLGYAHPSTLTRAMRRWSDQTPGSIRARADG